MEALVLDALNSTFEVSDMSSPYVMSPFAQANVAIRVCIAVIAVVANICTILAFYTDKTLTTSRQSDLIILNLAMTDFGVGIFVAPISAISPALGRWPFGESGCRIYNLVTTTLITGGVFSIVALSWDRYLLLTKEYPDYLRIQTRKTVLKLIAITWLASCVPGILENALWNVLKEAIIKLGKPVRFDRICSLPGTSLWQHSLSLGLFFRLVPVIAVIIFGILFLVGLKRRLNVWTKVGVAAASNEMSTSQGGSELKNLTAESSSRPSQTNTTTSRQDNADGHDDVALDSVEPSPSAEQCPQTKKKVHHRTAPKDNEENTSSHNYAGQHRTAQKDNNSHGHKSQVAITTQQKTKKTLHKRYIKPAIVYTFLIATLVICILPLHAYNTYVNAICPKCFNPMAMNMLINLGQFNSCLNPLLYAITYKKIRKFYSKLFSSIFKCKFK